MTTEVSHDDEVTQPARRVWTPDVTPAIDPSGRRIVPVLSGERPIGVYVVDPDGVEWFPITPRSHAVAGPLVSGLLGAFVGSLVARRLAR